MHVDDALLSRRSVRAFRLGFLIDLEAPFEIMPSGAGTGDIAHADE